MEKGRIHYAWWILFSCCVIFFTGMGVLVNCVGLFFQPVCADLGFTRAQVSLYVTIMNFAMVIALPFAGYIFPKVNIKLILALALGVSSISFALMGTFHHLSSWYINGAVRGICNAFIMYLPLPILIGNWFYKKRGLDLGIALCCSGLAGAIFNPIANTVIVNYGWRVGYAFLGIICAVISLPVVIGLVKYQPSDMGLKPYGYEEGAEENVVAEKEDWSGVSSKQAVKSAAFVVLFFFAGLTSLAAYLSPQLPGYAVSLGYASAVGALMVSCVMVGQLAGKVGLGYLCDKVGVVGATTVGCIAGALGMVLLIMGTKNVSLLYWAAFLFGIGFSLAMVQPPILVRQIFGSKDYSSIFSYVTMGTALIGGLGTYIFGYIFDVTGSFYYAIILCLAVYIVCFFLVMMALSLGKRLRTPASN
ncbi:MAG TPA: MFS transporter [Syntrophomonadaceae bacterium]|nr:MFS transporter [Syntrophomonadaceae bacterium]